MVTTHHFLSVELKIIALKDIRRAFYVRGWNLMWSASLVALLRNGERFPPIRLNRRPDGSLWLLDGRQRIEALKSFGAKAVSAEIFSVPEVKEADVARAFRTNSLTAYNSRLAVRRSQKIAGLKVRRKKQRQRGGRPECLCQLVGKPPLSRGQRKQAVDALAAARGGLRSEEIREAISSKNLRTVSAILHWLKQSGNLRTSVVERALPQG